MSLINIKEIKRDFKLGSEVLHVLKGINLNIEKGEYVALMGPSIWKIYFNEPFRLFGYTHFWNLYS